MTFLEAQDLVMDALTLTSTEARDRVKRWINQRLREVQSTLHLARTRRSFGTLVTVSGTPTAISSGTARVLGIYDDVVSHRPLDEIHLNDMIALEAQSTATGVPDRYAINDHLNDVVIVRLYPRPNQVLTLDLDRLAAGVELVDDDDEPTFPVDFHDILVRGAMADEYLKMQKKDEAGTEEKAFQRRLSELRLFIATSAYLSNSTRPFGIPGAHVWPYPGVGL